MFVVSNFMVAIVQLIGFVLTAYMWIVFARVVLSWVSPDPYNPIVQFIYRVTEPVLGRIRQYVPDMGGLDLSPMVLILVIVFLQNFLVRTLMQIANMFGGAS